MSHSYGGTWPPPGAFFTPRRQIHSFDIAFGGGYYFSSQASTVWSATNLAIFEPLLIETALSVTQFFNANGATVNGNVDIGLYTRDGTRIASTGSTVQAGITALQFINPSGGTFSIGPDVYYIGVAMDSAGPTATVRGNTTANAHLGRACGFFQQTAAFALPATATYATLTNTTVPTAGLVASQIPNSYRPLSPPIVTPFHCLSMGQTLAALAVTAATITASVSAAWPAANRAQYYPIFLPATTTFTQAFVMAGATWTGGGTPNHFDIGLYASDGTLIFSTGSTNANGTINALQVVDHTDFQVGPGLYYLALALDSTDATFRSILSQLQGIGAQQQAAAFALPASAAFTNNTSQYVPVFGFTASTVI